MKLDEVISKVWHIAMPKPQLGQTFLRYQEHYESPHFRGKTFTTEEYFRWYKQQTGKWDYYKEMDGFNVPSTILQPFKQGKFDPLTPLEQGLLDATQNIRGPFYLIGTDGKQATLNHELAHGLYFTNPEYRREVDKIVNSTNTAEMAEFLRKTGLYHEDVLQDELQAYLASDLRWIASNGVNTQALNEAKREIRKIFKKYHAAAKAALAI